MKWLYRSRCAFFIVWGIHTWNKHKFTELWCTVAVVCKV